MNLPQKWRVTQGQEKDFVAAITRYSNLRYELLPKAKIVFCPNDGTDGGLGNLNVRAMWPGRDLQGRLVANIYAVDSYNSSPHVTTGRDFTEKINSRQDNGAPLGLERHRQLARQLGVPFAIPEWSNNGDPDDQYGGGESPEYVTQFYRWVAQHSGDMRNPKPGQVLYEIQFNLWRQFAFWPQTIQPRTAAAYRALPWGRGAAVR
jgi:hypothetical protein